MRLTAYRYERGDVELTFTTSWSNCIKMEARFKDGKITGFSNPTVEASRASERDIKQLLADLQEIKKSNKRKDFISGVLAAVDLLEPGYLEVGNTKIPAGDITYPAIEQAIRNEIDRLEEKNG